MQLRTPSGLTSLEDIPAYKRNNIELTKTSHSSESEISSFTLTNKNESRTELRQDNSFCMTMLIKNKIPIPSFFINEKRMGVCKSNFYIIPGIPPP